MKKLLLLSLVCGIVSSPAFAVLTDCTTAGAQTLCHTVDLNKSYFNDSMKPTNQNYRPDIDYNTNQNNYGYHND